MISVVVPIYNVEKYLEECINSILSQSYSDIEIILVNDGSSDRCGEICEKYKKLDNRIIVIHQENGGLSNARNTGIKIARGKYICFIDSDDYIENNFLEILYKEAEINNLDIVCGSYTKLYSNGNKKTEKRKRQLYSEKPVEGIALLYKQFKLNDYRMEVWSNLYKRDFLVKNNLNFYDGLLHEDEEFTPNVFLKAKLVKFIESYGYIYRQRDNSIMNKKSSRKNIDSIKVIIDEMYEIFYKEDIDELSKCVISNIIVHLFNCLILKIKTSDIEDKLNEYANIDIQKIKMIMHYNDSLNLKVKIKIMILKISTKLFNSII